jgi:hypothetical protein
MLTILAMIIAFAAGAYVGASNADAVKKLIAVAVAAGAAAVTQVEAIRAYFGG